MSKKQETAIEKKESSLPATIDYGADAGAGMENVTSDHLRVPRLSIIQAINPQLKPKDGKFIPGAVQGDIYHSISNEIFKGEEGITVIPVYFEQTFIEWGDRKNPTPDGEGPFGFYAPTDTIVMSTPMDATFKRRLPNGHLLVDTREHTVLVVRKDGTYFPAVIAMSRSQVKKSENWVTAMKGALVEDAVGKKINPASYAFMYRITTMDEHSKAANTEYKNYRIETIGKVTDPEIYQVARELHKACVKGRVKADPIEAESDLPF